jgi:hypothetical protein
MQARKCGRPPCISLDTTMTVRAPRGHGTRSCMRPWDVANKTQCYCRSCFAPVAGVLPGCSLLLTCDHEQSRAPQQKQKRGRSHDDDKSVKAQPGASLHKQGASFRACCSSNCWDNLLCCLPPEPPVGSLFVNQNLLNCHSLCCVQWRDLSLAALSEPDLSERYAKQSVAQGQHVS